MAYKALGSDENAAKMSDCRYQTFLSYLLSAGPYRALGGLAVRNRLRFARGDGGSDPFEVALEVCK